MDPWQADSVINRLNGIGREYPELAKLMDRTTALLVIEHTTLRLSVDIPPRPTAEPAPTVLLDVMTDQPKFEAQANGHTQSNGHAPKLGKAHRFGVIEDVLPSPSERQRNAATMDKAVAATTLPGLNAPDKEWVSSDEFAVIVGRSAYSVGDWCRQGRLNATQGKGYRNPGSPRWSLHRSELARYLKEGLLDACPCRNKP